MRTGPPICKHTQNVRLRVARHQGHKGRRCGLCPAGGHARALLPPDHLLPASCPGSTAGSRSAAAPAPRAVPPASPGRPARAPAPAASTVPAVLHRQLLAGRLALRQAQVIDPLPVHLLPGRVDHPGQPARRRGGQRLQRRPHRLPGQLQPVQVPDPGQHMRGIGALPPPAPTRPSASDAPAAGRVTRSAPPATSRSRNPGSTLASNPSSSSSRPRRTSSPPGPAPHRPPAGPSGSR